MIDRSTIATTTTVVTLLKINDLLAVLAGTSYALGLAFTVAVSQAAEEA